MIIYIVSMSTTRGPHGPTVNMTYHKDFQDALDEYLEHLKSLGEDPSTIILSRIDGETMVDTILDYFQGNEGDFMYQWGKDYVNDNRETVNPV